MFGLEDELRDRLEEANRKIEELKMERIIVEVSGGVAYCSDPRVKIVDYDNLKLEDG